MIGIHMAKDTRIGRLSFATDADKRSIPIYGVNSLDLNRASGFDAVQNSINAVYVLVWNGSTPVKFQFNFELVAGVSINPSGTGVMTREDLQQCMRTAHALSAHRNVGNNILPPPPARLVIGAYISSKGYVDEINCSAKAPWGPKMEPTSCVFSGTFTIMPGYEGKLVTIGSSFNGASQSGQQTGTSSGAIFESESIYQKFYTDGQ